MDGTQKGIMHSIRRYINLLFNENPGLLKAICTAVLLIILMAGFWPFNFNPVNNVVWLPDRAGVRFHSQGMAVSADDGQMLQALLLQNKSMTLEIRLRPAMETSDAPSILSLYDGETPELLAIKQWRSHMVVWSRADDPKSRKRGKPYQEMGFRDALQPDKDAFITIASGEDGTSLYSNGNLMKTYPQRQLIVSDIKGELRLILGCSPIGESCWTGSIMGLAIHAKKLSADQVEKNYQLWIKNDFETIKHAAGIIDLYPFREGQGSTIANLITAGEPLIVPDYFRPPLRKKVTMPWQDFQWKWNYAQDIIINILGFIPLGFFFSALLSNRTRLRKWPVFIITAAIGLSVSFTIEILQIFLPTRNPQIMDVIMNTAGTIAGIALFQQCKDD